MVISSADLIKVSVSLSCF